MTPLFRIQLKNLTEQILHMPGALTGKVPEMAMVYHTGIEKEEAAETAKEFLLALKKQNDIFRNIRLNLVLWDSDEKIRHIVTSSAKILTGAFFEENYIQTQNDRRLEILMENLKLFQARSKLIFLFTTQDYRIEESGRLQEALKPFLNRKLIVVENGQMQRGISDIKPCEA